MWGGRIFSKCIALAAAGACASSAPTAQAQTAGTLGAKQAQAVIAGCVAQASSKMQSHAIVVVDLGGRAIASLRMDGNPYGIMDFALTKAVAAAAWGFSTADMEINARSTPGFAQAPLVVTVAGGVPIFSNDGRTRVGAVGVSGESPADDAGCALAGIAAAGLVVRPN